MSYQYFHEAGGFAAVPFVEKGGRKSRSFNLEGLPLCAAGLPMPLKFTFTDRTSTLVVHERGKYVCPLRGLKTAPAGVPPAAPVCPINHKTWPKGGCTAMTPALHQTRAVQVCRPAWAHACVTNSTGRARRTRRSTSSAPPMNARIARPSISAHLHRHTPPVQCRCRAPPLAPPERHHQPEYPDLRAHQPARPAAHPPAQGGAGSPAPNAYHNPRLIGAAHPCLWRRRCHAGRAGRCDAPGSRPSGPVAPNVGSVPPPLPRVPGACYPDAPCTRPPGSRQPNLMFCAVFCRPIPTRYVLSYPPSYRFRPPM